MTRKDFEAIAAVLHSTKPAADKAYDLETWTHLVKAFAAMCAAHNPRFAANRFFAACGMES